MYLHLGLDRSVPYGDIIGIFDLDTTTVSKTTRNYLSAAEKAKNVVNVCLDLPKSFIVCSETDCNNKVYISQLSPQTLNKRANSPY